MTSARIYLSNESYLDFGRWDFVADAMIVLPAAAGFAISLAIFKLASKGSARAPRALSPALASVHYFSS